MNKQPTSAIVIGGKTYPESGVPYTDWYVPMHGEYDDFIYDVGRDCAYAWMKKLSVLRKTKVVHWFSPYSLKHHVEDWKEGNPDRRYVSRDMVTAAAMLAGLPVIIDDKNHDNNRVGLYMTRLQYKKYTGR